MIKVIRRFICDSCKKEVENKDELFSVELMRSSGVIHRDACIDCFKKFTKKIDNIDKEMFLEED